MKNDPFQKYYEELEPDKARKGYAWGTAVGLQKIDGLSPSAYLIDVAEQNIAGDLTLTEVRDLVNEYYEEKTVIVGDDNRTEEADKVALRITEILSEEGFTFSSHEYLAIHRRLFQGIYAHAGKLRERNITKKEWILEGATVIYGSATELQATLEYDFSQEENFDYRGLTMPEIIHHLAVFISRLWQIHAFREGNTRTTAVFLIKYLRTLGFLATNDIFAKNAWYFRNALVRANYTDLQRGIHETTEYLEKFLENLLLRKQHVLRNRDLHISGYSTDLTWIARKEEQISNDINEILVHSSSRFSEKTRKYIVKLYLALGDNQIFGRGKVMEILPLKTSAASKLLRKLKDLGLIEEVTGHGKGKYRLVSLT